MICSGVGAQHLQGQEEAVLSCLADLMENLRAAGVYPRDRETGSEALVEQLILELVLKVPVL